MVELNDDIVKGLFTYSDGKLYRRISLGGQAAGKEAGSGSCRAGYRQVRIFGKYFLAHRLIFLMHHGYMPQQVDHINRDPSDNRIENLRACTNQQNSCNSTLYSTNKSGVKGVCWSKVGNKWRGYIMVNGKQITCGCYDTIEQAAVAVKAARIKYHGEFASDGISK